MSKTEDRGVRRKYEFIKANRKKYNTRMMCRLLDVAPSGYYAWLKKPSSDRAIEDKRLLKLIRASFAASQGVYGAPRVRHVISSPRTGRVQSRGGPDEWPYVRYGCSPAPPAMRNAHIASSSASSSCPARSASSVAPRSAGSHSTPSGPARWPLRTRARRRTRRGERCRPPRSAPIRNSRSVAQR